MFPSRSDASDCSIEPWERGEPRPGVAPGCGQPLGVQPQLGWARPRPAAVQHPAAHRDGTAAAGIAQRERQPNLVVLIFIN